MLTYFTGKIGRRYRWLQLRLAGANIAYGVQIHDRLVYGPAAGLECAVAWFAPGVRLLIVKLPDKPLARLRIGAGTFINFFTVIDCHDRITIGNNVAIGPHCYIGDFDHPVTIGQRAGADDLTSPVTIEDDVWLGAGVTVLRGVTIGRGAIIAAGSVVTRDVAPWTVVAGVPARYLKDRPGNASRDTLKQNPNTT